MTCLGLTGGIGSGKTVVARVFEILNYPVYYTDFEAKRIMQDSMIVKEKLVDFFGDEIYIANQLNKPLLAKLIFNNNDNLHFVNSVVHPEVTKDFLLWKDKQNDKKISIIESAILFESGLNNLVDITVAVTAPLEVRINRTIIRDNASREAIIERINNQISEEKRTELADHVIINDDVQALLPQINQILSSLNS
ncbi:dephospho-CoA kinase [Bacteroidales bacterium OttesenSCG-928-M11]|nr:dephospho-CoA kinase [Bacteroidales bacterium OttesenSCG-928-M11]